MILTAKKSDLVKETTMVAPQGLMSKADWKSYTKNFFKFIAPTLAVFFAQLALGVDIKVASLVAMLAFYQTASDFFGKLSDGPKKS